MIDLPLMIPSQTHHWKDQPMEVPLQRVVEVERGPAPEEAKVESAMPYEMELECSSCSSNVEPVEHMKVLKFEHVKVFINNV